MINLRWYQEEACAAIMEDWGSGNPNALVSLPTATGKTYTFTALISKIYKPGDRVLIIAHTKELVQQPRSSFETLFSPEYPKVKLGIVQGEQRDYKADVIFATIQTLYRDGYKALSEILRHGPINYFIIDETHHVVADTYRGCKERLGSMDAWLEGVAQQKERKDALAKLDQDIKELEQEVKTAQGDLLQQQLGAHTAAKDKLARKIKRWNWVETFDFQNEIRVNGDLLTLGVTATPYRTDNISLGEIFPEVEDRDRFTYLLTIRQAINADVLAPIKVMHVITKWDTSGIKMDVTGGDKQWNDLLEAENGYEIIIDQLLIAMNPDKFPNIDNNYDFEKHHQLVLEKVFNGELVIKPTAFFMPTIETSAELVRRAGEIYGITAGHIDGSQCLKWDGAIAAKVGRDELLTQFQDKEYLWISNYGVLTEGWDAPHLEFGVMLRRTQSLTLYVQMIGRYLRKDPNNPNKIAHILQFDYAGHQLADATALTGRPVPEEIDEIEKLFEQLTAGTHEAQIPPCPACGAVNALERLRGTREYECKECDSFCHGDDIDDGLPEFVSEKTISGKGAFTKFLRLFAEATVAWYREDGLMSVSLGTSGQNGTQASRTLVILPPDKAPLWPSTWNLIEFRKPVKSWTWAGNRWHRYKRYSYGSPVGLVVGQADSFSEIVDLANNRANEYMQPELADKNKAWRDKEPSPKLITQLTDRFKVPEELIFLPCGKPKITMGDASRMYAHHEALEYMRKKSVID